MTLDTYTVCAYCMCALFVLICGAYESCDNTRCMACNTHNTCTQCKDGYYVTGGYCNSCQDNCFTCKYYDYCKVCNDGFYSFDLNSYTTCAKCPIHCEKCNSTAFCSKCKSGYYSKSCGSNCNICKDGACSKTDCTYGCTDGYYQHYYSDNYGYCLNCVANCKSCTNSSQCNTCHDGFHLIKYNGGYACNQCSSGCMSCSSPSDCESCPRGRWKSNCESHCPVGCENNTCNIYTGLCNEGCAEGYYMKSDGICYTCSQSSSGCHCPDFQYYTDNICVPCTDGYWGRLCNKSCDSKCFDRKCNVVNGHCDSCNQTRYGHFCEHKCNNNCNNPSNGSSVCNNSGECLFGCHIGWSGRKCNSVDRTTIPQINVTRVDKALTTTIPPVEQTEAKPQAGVEDTVPVERLLTTTVLPVRQTEAKPQTGDEDTVPVGIIAGSVGGAFFILLVTGAVVAFIYMKRRKKTATESNRETTNPAQLNDNSDTRCIYAFPNEVKMKTEDEAVSIEITGSSGQLHAVPQRSIRLSSPYNQETNVDADDVLEEIDEESTTVVNVKTDPQTDTYYNIAGLKRSRIQVDNLLEYVNQKTDFEKEFQKFPKGLTRPYTEASKPSNVLKNRYRGIYPYDVSRVRLRDGSTDFINASFLDGYNKTSAYIASLGPTSQHMGDFVTFWRMVWQEKVEKIVMLTNLMEVAKMKCEQYWPDPEQAISYGDVTVLCEREDVFAEFIVRVFNVSKYPVQRTLHQIHFTAWPDRSVPDTVTSLIEFRQIIQSIQTRLGGPIIVHCSAGIGRTGTYIALDSLTAEGETEKSVDIFGCVMGMRGQRVNMVQNEVQYEYLHNAVVHSLIFDSQPIKVGEFQDFVSTKTEQMEIQYKIIATVVDRKPEEEIDAIAKHIHYRDKNRKGAAIPGDRHRPLLMVHMKTGSSSYINAVFINSFSRKNRYVAAQTPLPGTVTNFLLMVTQQRVSCIVSLDEENIHDKNVGTYLPAANQVLKHGPFHISCRKSQSTSQYILRTLVISHHEKGQTEEYTLSHFQFTQWKQKQPVPTDSSAFLQLVKDVERADAGTELTGPIVIHCLTGGERSCLFCVVSVLIQKMEIEQKVSVVNTVRQVRSRRGNAIPNKEQYIFSHQCVSAYLNTDKVYANMSVLV